MFMNNPLLTEDIGVYLMDMDTGIDEQIIYNSDGSFTIFINSRFNCERQMKAYQHAIKHIMEKDYEKSSADDIEKVM